MFINDYQMNRFNDIAARYKQMYLDPENCSPMFIIDVPVNNLPDCKEQFNNPHLMLKAELAQLVPHMEIEDDRLPTVRVQFGTGQIASAFGCEIDVPEGNLPRTKGHVIQNSADVYGITTPPKDGGLFARLKTFTEIFLENLPKGVHIQHPDVQSPFNNAHLIRGNEILLDFYDDPDAVDALLGIIADYMADMVSYLKNMISNDKEWFYDWGALWKGAARISNCTCQMISPEMYTKHVLPKDIRLMRAIDGGRIHYCGTSGKVIDEFFKNPEITGLDFDPNYHNLWELAERAPKNLVLMQYQDIGFDSPAGQRLLSGDWPKKRNIILHTTAKSVEEGKELLMRFKRSVPK